MVHGSGPSQHPEHLTDIHRCTIESTLLGCVNAWFVNSSAQDCNLNLKLSDNIPISSLQMKGWSLIKQLMVGPSQWPEKPWRWCPGTLMIDVQQPFSLYKVQLLQLECLPKCLLTSIPGLLSQMRTIYYFTSGVQSFGACLDQGCDEGCSRVIWVKQTGQQSTGYWW